MKTGWTFAWCIAIAAATSATAQPPFGRVTATLAPAPDLSSPTPPTDKFFHPATLTVENNSAYTIRAVLLKPVGGGPSIFWPCVMPMKSNPRNTVTLPLPAFSAAQPYVVNLLAEASPYAKPVAVAEATIDWPADLVRREFLSADVAPAHWPANAKRNAVLLLTLGLLAMAATLLIRRPAWRTAAALAVAAGVTIAVVAVLHAQPDVYEQRLPASRVPGADGDIIAVSALRTTQWSSEKPLVPVYQTMAEFRADQSIIHPGRSITLPLRAGQTRLFTHE